MAAKGAIGASSRDAEGLSLTDPLTQGHAGGAQVAAGVPPPAPPTSITGRGNGHLALCPQKPGKIRPSAS
jgi:hypothetical protein